MDMKASSDVTSDDVTGDSDLYNVILYGSVSFLIVSITIVLIYVACSKKYRLNWFEKNLLETANASELATSQDALIGQSSSAAGSSTSLLNIQGQEKLWSPILNQGQNDVIETSEDDSISNAPSSPVHSKSSLVSDQISVDDSGDNRSVSSLPQPIARSDRHVVLTTTNPMRPKVASMHTKLDHTKLDMSLYEEDPPSRSPSAEDLRGSVNICLNYDPSAQILSVRLIQAQGLRARDFSGSTDPYAKIRLLPDRTNVWQTRIHKKTLDPVFDEDFVFEVRPTVLPRRTLEVILYDFDAYSRHHSIGGVKLPLNSLDLTEKVTLWKSLSSCSQQDDKAELGDLMVSLAYLSSAERLTVVVMKARNLRVVDDSRTSSDPYIKVTVLHGGKRLKKKKTAVHRNTVNPVFNEALTFDVNKDILPKCAIEFCVYHDNLIGSSELLGRAVVGNSSSCRPAEREFFHEMLSSKTATAQWLVLSEPQ